VESKSFVVAHFEVGGGVSGLSSLLRRVRRVVRRSRLCRRPFFDGGEHVLAHPPFFILQV
jgi:hypothetical protein